MLAYATTAALRNAPEKDLRTVLRDRIMRPIGVPDADWGVGYGKIFEVDGLPLVPAWGGGNYTARASARVGRLMLCEGDWDGRRILKPESVHAVLGDAGTSRNSGIGWWHNDKGTLRDLPRDSFWGRGAGHQIVLVIPRLRLIVVRNGENLDPAIESEEALTRYFFQPLMRALGMNRWGTLLDASDL